MPIARTRVYDPLVAAIATAYTAAALVAALCVAAAPVAADPLVQPEDPDVHDALDTHPTPSAWIPGAGPGHGLRQAPEPTMLARAGGTDAVPAPVRATLSNGVQVVVARDPAQPVVAMHALWSQDHAVHTPAQRYARRLIGELLVRGCGDRGRVAIERVVEAAGAHLSATAGRDTVAIRATWPTQEWQQGLALVTDCARAPTFTADELAAARARLARLAATRAAMASVLAQRALLAGLYPRHPYGLDDLDGEGSAPAWRPRSLRSFYHRHLPLSRLTLAVVGAVDPDRVLAAVSARFGAALGPARAPNVVTPTPPRPAASERYLPRSGAQAELVIGFPGATVTDPDQVALELLAELLGGRDGVGRLAHELRQRRGLAHAVEVQATAAAAAGYFAVRVGCRPEDIDAVVRVTRAELARVATEVVSEHELAQARARLLADNARAAADPRSRAAALAYHAAHGLVWGGHRARAAAIEAVDAPALRRVAAATLDWNAAVTITVGPERVSPGAARRIRGVRRRLPRSRGRRGEGKR
ncbi:M16 family metallopeptidase [Haliangium sp.]|uniref:M16 family metallopeptidase n=1 Tax=Haliangium sp. TaxID=2663208 RepID=UPI003D0FDA61